MCTLSEIYFKLRLSKIWHKCVYLYAQVLRVIGPPSQPDASPVLMSSLCLQHLVPSPSNLRYLVTFVYNHPPWYMYLVHWNTYKIRVKCFVAEIFYSTVSMNGIFVSVIPVFGLSLVHSPPKPPLSIHYTCPEVLRCPLIGMLQNRNEMMKTISNLMRKHNTSYRFFAVP